MRFISYFFYLFIFLFYFIFLFFFFFSFPSLFLFFFFFFFFFSLPFFFRSYFPLLFFPFSSDSYFLSPPFSSFSPPFPLLLHFPLSFRFPLKKPVNLLKKTVSLSLKLLLLTPPMSTLLSKILSQVFPLSSYFFLSLLLTPFFPSFLLLSFPLLIPFSLSSRNLPSVCNPHYEPIQGFFFCPSFFPTHCCSTTT